MLVMPGPPSSRKTGAPGFAERARMRVTGSAISREPRIGPVLRHDERAAVGGVAAVLGRVVTRLQDDLAGVRAVGTETGSSPVPKWR